MTSTKNFEMQLTIGIDFDKTFTADSKTWSDVIKILKSAGHIVICVSTRTDFEFNRTELLRVLPDGVPVLLSSDRQKSDYAQSMGYNVDIWIDDIPASIPPKEELKRTLSWVEKTEE